MIEKMKFLSITGPKDDIDRVVGTYLNRYPIHLENALTELSLARDLYPYMQVNPYREILIKAREYAAMLPEDAEPSEEPMTVEAAADIVEDLQRQVLEKKNEQEALEKQYHESEELIRQLAPFRTLPVDVEELLHFRFIHYRFGKIPMAGYQRLKEYVYDTMDVIFYKCHVERDYVWGIYFVPESHVDRVDAIMSTLHFERVFMPDAYKGTGVEAYTDLQKECLDLAKQIAAKRREITELMNTRADELLRAKKALEDLTFTFDVRKVAAVTKEKEHTFYILCGWMAEDDVVSFQKEIENDKSVYVIVENPEKNFNSTPPTKLKNPAPVRPFEMYTRMYGLPSYGEIDPTIFVAITYSFIFGAMFGDLGQGLCR